jgi:hypothetical protein
MKACPLPFQTFSFYLILLFLCSPLLIWLSTLRWLQRAAARRAAIEKEKALAAERMAAIRNAGFRERLTWIQNDNLVSGPASFVHSVPYLTRTVGQPKAMPKNLHVLSGGKGLPYK